MPPNKIDNLPEYKDIGERELALKNSMKTYKHETLAEMRETGTLDTQVYGRVKAEKDLIKKVDHLPRDFPAKADEIKYPQSVMKGNLLYQTSNMNYGAKIPGQQDLPTKFHPRPESFTSTFLAGQYHDTGLNTFKTPSRFHATLDQ